MTSRIITFIQHCHGGIYEKIKVDYQSTFKATLLGGLSAFIGTATPGGTLTVQTWERNIGTQYYQKYRIKFTTSTGEVWGPVETIKAY